MLKNSEGKMFSNKFVISLEYSYTLQTKVLINNEAMSRDERFFPRAKDYLPERWMRDNNSELAKESKSHPFVVRPFGFGARMCPGQRIAEMQMLICIAKVRYISDMIRGLYVSLVKVICIWSQVSHHALLPK